MKRLIYVLINVFVLSALISTARADNWIMNWGETAPAPVADTIWDVDAYVDRDIYFRLHGRAIFVGSYIASTSTQYGMAGTWELDTSLHPIRGVRLFKSPGNVINFQSVDPIYTYVGPIRSKEEIAVSKFWVAGYSHIRTSGRDTNILITKLDRNLNHLYTKEYDLNSEVDVLYKIYTVNYSAMASNEAIKPPIVNGLAGIGYTTYGEKFHNENILFVAGDTSGDIFAACVFETPGRDVGMGLYEVESGKFIAIGYTNFNGGSDTSYSPIVIKFAVTPNGCNVLWSKVYRVDGYTLVPYDIDRTLYIEGAMYNITGTAVPLSSPTNQTKGFMLAIDTYGHPIGMKFYDSRVEREAIVLFEEYVDTTSNQIIAVGSWYPDGFLDTLRRFISPQKGSSKIPNVMNVMRNKALILTLSNTGGVVGTRIYGFTPYDHLNHTLLFAVSNIEDTSLISAGSFYDAGTIGSVPIYYAVKTNKPPLDNQPYCSSPLNIVITHPHVEVFTPPILVFTAQPTKYLIDPTPKPWCQSLWRL